MNYILENQSSIQQITPLKVVALTCLTFLMYATGIYFQDGVFLLPIALFKPSIMFVVIIALLPNIQSIRYPEVLLLIWGVLIASSSTFVFQFFYSEAEYEAKWETISGLQSVLLLLAICVLYVWQIWCAFQLKGLARVLNLINASCFVCCLLVPNLILWLIVPTIMWIITFNSPRFKASIHYSIALYLLFIVSCLFITGLVYGEMPVISAL